MAETTTPRKGWLDRNIFGMGLASLFGDFCYEMSNAVLPMFLATIGASAASLGLIEGFSDAISSFSKMGAGHYSDKMGKRKPIAALGYFITAIAVAAFGFATSAWQLLVARSVGWFGRGVKGPPRDAMLSDATTPEVRGRAFGFHRSMDTIGAVIGPFVAFILVDHIGYRHLFFISFIPGLLAVAAFLIFTKETPHLTTKTVTFWANIKAMPREFQIFLIVVAVFGVGDFAHTLLILRASQSLTPILGEHDAGQKAILLYTWHNIVYAAAAYPAGVLADRFGKKIMLIIGFIIAALMALGFAVAIPSFWNFAGLFTLGGIFLGITDSMEGALAADLLPQEIRATGYGVLATVNGIGDLVSSAMVGILWTSIAPSVGFIYSAALSILAAAVLIKVRKR